MEKAMKVKGLKFSAKAMEQASVVEGPACVGCKVKKKKKQVLSGYNNHIF